MPAPVTDRWLQLLRSLWIYGFLFSILPIVVSEPSCSQTVLPHPPVVLHRPEVTLFYNPDERPRYEAFRCPVSRTTADDEDTSIRWLFMNDTLGHPAGDGSELVFAPLAEAHVGEYVCEARNTAGLSRSNVFRVTGVTPMSGPAEGPSQLRLVLLSGQAVSLRCPTPPGIPTPSVTWRLISVEPGSNPQPNPYVVDPTGTLHIPFASKKHNGSVWQCIAKQLTAEKVLQVVELEVRPRPLECGDQPRFLYVPDMNTVVKDENTDLFCIASGPGWTQPQWTWDRGMEAAVRGVMPLQVNSSTLAGGKDRFRLSCFVNGLSHTVALRLQTPPKIIDVPDKDVTEGDEISVNCEARGIPPPTIQWFFNGENALPSEMRDELYRVKVDRAHQRHNGVLRCVASNSHGTVYRDTHIVVHNKSLHIIAERRCFNAVEGETLVIPCTVGGGSEPRRTWWRHKEELTSQVNNEGGLELVNLRAEDRGQYRCIACEKPEPCVAYEVTVEVLPSILQKTPPKPLEAYEDERLTLECVPMGRADDKADWFVNGTLVHTGHVYTVEPPLRPGTYSCKLNNGTIMGADLWEAELQVMKRPSLPQVTAQCKSEKALLSWQSAVEEQVLWYEIQRRSTWGDPWKLIDIVHPPKNNKLMQFETDLPKIRGKYTFRVAAHNRAGARLSPVIKYCESSVADPPLRSPKQILVTRLGQEVIVNWEALEPHEQNADSIHYKLCMQTVSDTSNATSDCHRIFDTQFIHIFTRPEELPETKFSLASVNAFGESAPARFAYECNVSIWNTRVDHVHAQSVYIRWSWHADEEACRDFDGVLLIRRLSASSYRYSRRVYADTSTHPEVEPAPADQEEEVAVDLSREEILLDGLDDQKLYCVRLRATLRSATVSDNATAGGAWTRAWESADGELCFYPSVVFEELPLLPDMEMRDGILRLLEPPPSTQLLYYSQSEHPNEAGDRLDSGEAPPPWIRSNTSVEVSPGRSYVARLVQFTAVSPNAGTSAAAGDRLRQGRQRSSTSPGVGAAQRVCRMSRPVTLTQTDQLSWLLWLAGAMALVTAVFVTLVVMFRRRATFELINPKYDWGSPMVGDQACSTGTLSAEDLSVAIEGSPSTTSEESH